MNSTLKFTLGFVALSIASIVSAQTGAIEVKSQALVEKISPKGEKSMVVAATTVPGTELTYVTTFKNVSTKAVENVAIDNPVPVEITYKSDSATGANTNIVFSVDHGKTFGKLEQLKVKGDDGQVRAAISKDVTNIRWTLAYALKPGQEGTASYKGILK